MSVTPALEATSLIVNRGGRRILDILSLQVMPGEVLVIIGPNGSGKTTLVQCLALLLKPDSGMIAYGGNRITSDHSALQQRRRLAVVFQEPLLLRGTVRDNVSLGLRLRRFPRHEITSRVERWLGRFGIAGLSDRQVSTLSGGEAQRVSLARAFALGPDVMFLDEPFAALDAPTRQSLGRELAMVLRETGTTTVMVTHDRNEALALGDRVAVLIDGQIQQSGPPQSVFSRPANEVVAKFVGVDNIMPGTVIAQDNGIARVLLDGSITVDAVSDLAPGTPVAVCLRPEDIVITSLEPAPTTTSTRNRLRCRVTDLSPSGAQTRVGLDCGVGLIAFITSRSCQELGLTIGREVTASFKATAVHLIPRR
ncbi:MAG: ABC transporter ATP-binding protein [Dehalococcoidia bacterium]|nr:ABC transporter ATP-binding protein [Dehalococcoidia bacterium]